MFSAPIPGQSLTTPPKNYPWERPPEIVDPEEAIQYHIARLTDPDVIGAALDLIELENLDIHTLTKGVIRGAVSQGIHNIDVGLIAAPVIHELIKQAAVAAKLPFEEGFEDKKGDAKRQQQVQALRAKKKLETMGVKPAAVVAEEPVEEVVEEVQPKRGLMAREDMR